MPIRRRLKKTPKQYSNASKDSIEDAEALESDKSVVVVASEHVANIEFGNGVERYGTFHPMLEVDNKGTNTSLPEIFVSRIQLSVYAETYEVKAAAPESE